MNLLPVIEGADRLLIFDAIDRGEAPGTIIRLEGVISPLPQPEGLAASDRPPRGAGARRAARHASPHHNRVRRAAGARGDVDDAFAPGPRKPRPARPAWCFDPQAWDVHVRQGALARRHLFPVRDHHFAATAHA